MNLMNILLLKIMEQIKINIQKYVLGYQKMIIKNMDSVFIMILLKKIILLLMFLKYQILKQVNMKK